MKTAPILSQGSHRGSVVIAVLLMALIIVSTVTIYLRSAVQEMKFSERTFALQQSINLAEMGAESAINSLNNDDWSAWQELATDQYYKSFTPTGSTDIIYTFVNMTDPTNVWIATGSEVDVSNDVVSKQLYIRLGYRSMFANGLTAKNQIMMNGNQIDIDSYNSANGPYNVTTNRNDGGSVASVSVAVNTVLIDNADILGYVSTGGSNPRVGPNGSIRGFGSPSGTKIDASRVSKDFYADFPGITTPSTSGAQTSFSSAFVGTTGASTKYYFNNLAVTSSQTLYVMGDVEIIVEEDMDVKGSVYVMPGSSLTLYVKDDLAVGGNGVMNLTGKPENFIIYSPENPSRNQTIKIHGNGALSAVIYAPDADLELKGGGSSGVFYGAAVADSITLTGNYDFHYDEALKDFSPEENYRMLEWRELTAATDRYPLKSPMALVASTTSTTN